jgi:pre-mRNA-splicing factor RBM22/SLT11
MESLAIARIDKNGVESGDFPIVCENCLGPDKNLRMTKANAGSTCKVCERGFTVFRWKAGVRGRFKSTVVCQSCAKMKNVCQCCLYDLQFGLPVQVRDKYLADSEQMPMPTSKEGIAYHIQQQPALLDSSTSGPLALQDHDGTSGYSRLSANPELQRIARTTPYYGRNQAPICSFFQKGECNRGDACPYRHMKKLGGGPTPSIESRFHGINDPEAQKLIKNAASRLANFPSPPEDQSITTLFITNVPEDTIEEECDSFLRSQFDEFGTIRNIKIVRLAKIAFVEFETRKSAEDAITAKFNHPSMTYKNQSRLRVSWARPKQKPTPIQTSGVLYPSMDPSNMGDAPLRRNT